MLYRALSLILAASALYAADSAAPKPAAATPKPVAAPRPPPTLANVAYGTHPKQVLDFYQAKSDKPTPLVFQIHGGGWSGGSKAVNGADVYLRHGISLVS